jgi:hypothetical protein
MTVVEDIEIEEDDLLCDTCDYPTEHCECCGSCDSYPCRCCDECGYANCECCGDCESYLCRCSEGHGTSTIAPWVARNHRINLSSRSNKNWTKVWPEVDTKIDPVQCAADFYLLEAIAAKTIFQYEAVTLTLDSSKDEEMLDLLGVTEPKKRAMFIKDKKLQIRKLLSTDQRHKLVNLERTAKTMQEDLVSRLDAIFIAYTHMAIAGEVRHHRAIGGLEMSSDRAVAWSQWRDIYESVGNQAILDVRDLFLEMDDGTYGGEPWANAAYILYQRHEGLLGPNPFINQKLFIDRIFSLEHNGGALLDKVTWELDNVKGWFVGDLKKVLDAHASNPTDILLLMRIASLKVRNLAKQYIDTGLEGNISSTFEDLESIRRDVDVKPNFICRACGSNARKGHFYECLGRYRPFNGSIKNVGNFSVRWSHVDSLYFPKFATENYPVTANYKINLDSKQTALWQITVLVETSNWIQSFKKKFEVDGTIRDFLNIQFTEEIKNALLPETEYVMSVDVSMRKSFSRHFGQQTVNLDMLNGSSEDIIRIALQEYL